METIEERVKNVQSKITELKSAKIRMEGEKEVYKKELKAMGFSSLKEAINKQIELENEQKKLTEELNVLLTNLEKELGINE
jgi:hypothetical protein